jgi:pyruvate formate lyase activating enzyme
VGALTVGKEATLYQQLPSGRVRCTACARYCNIGEGQVGLCGIRGNTNGKLWLYVYGKIIAGNVDPIEKKPVTHYMPGTKIFSIATTGCNWLCHPAGTQILLANGQKRCVEDLLPGDSLWSYDVEDGMKIAPDVVTHLGRRRACLWEVRYGSHGHGRLVITKEHPILTKRGWKTVEELRSGDQILKVWYQNTQVWKRNRAASIDTAEFTCGKCDAEVKGFDEWNRHRGECYTRGLEKTPEVLASYSKRMKLANPMKDHDVARRAIQSSKERFLMDPDHGWYRNAERLRTWLHRHPSVSQLRLYELLGELGVKYEKEYRIHPEKKIRGSQTYYLADAAFPDINLDIEVDGWWHYHNERIQERDKIRDRVLRTNGWDVLRISGGYLYNHPQEVKALIAENLQRPVLRNKREWVTVKKVGPTSKIEVVYSFECIPKHNYVADGIISHNCQYCQNFDISQRRKIEGLDATPESVVEMTKRYRCEGLAYTYNEPSIFIEFAHDIGVQARKAGLINIFVSNGYDTPDTVGLMRDFLDCITVDFKGSGETSFVRKYIGIANADPIFQTLLELRDKTKVHIEITDLIVPEVGDDLGAAKKLSSWVYDNLGPDTPIHFLRFHSDYKMMNLPPTPIKTLEKHHAVAKEIGLNYAYLGNVPGHPLEHTYCPECGKVVVERLGFDITGWHMDDQNRCKYCGNEIAIVGHLSKSINEERFIPIIM